MSDLFSVKDKIVVITGGTGVLGRTIAAHLASEGAKVVILGRNETVGNEIVKDILKKGGEAIFLKTDVLDRTLLEKNRDEILSRYSRIDALLNAAGGNMAGAIINPEQTFFDLKIEEFEKVVRLNLTGTVLPTQVFLKPMVEQKKGSIVNFSSMAAFRPMTRVAGYAAAKAGISNFTQFLAAELAIKFGEGIRVNAIAPGFVDTEMTEVLSEEIRENACKQIILGRFGKPEDIANTAVFLASDKADYITGQVISVDGGMNV